MRESCPLCDAALGAPFVERPGVPMLQNVLVDSATAARAVPRGDLALSHCPSCDFVANVSFDPARLAYGSDYENVQVCSDVFDQYVDGLVERLVGQGVSGKRVVEVGCGTGYFLRKLCERGGNEGVGFDTTYRGPEWEGPVRFVRDHYGAGHRDVAADVVLCRHVIEHVPEPLTLLAAVRGALDGSPGALVVFETPALEWVLEGVVYQDLFYEHCSYFSEGSLTFAFRRAGFSPRVVERVFGGQYLWLEARDAGPGDEGDPPGGVLGAAVARYGEEEHARLEATGRRLTELAEAGPVAVWGAGAKGVTFCNLLDPDSEAITCVVDINPNKQGRFVPGTGHAIRPPEALVEEGLRNVLVMNPNYLDECRRLASERGVNPSFYTEETAWR